MQENLVIVESPAKAKTIEKFLGADFLVKSSFGHIRDLSKKELGVDIHNNFEPQYIVSPDKEAVVRELKKLAKSAKTVWLASDEDREGEAIAWHLKEALGLKEQHTHRIVFHEITKEAILKAVNNPRGINIDLVNAQQARRVLDRLVGFEVSPVLWKKVRANLSAGRVQSVAVRIIVDREREIILFTPESFFKVTALFVPKEGTAFKLKADLNHKFNNQAEAETFLEQCAKAQFKINTVEKKPGKKTPAPPFITSTLQQEASRKFGFSVSQTMSVAQKLYESGFITYMRTDSTNLSDLALATAQTVINQMYGAKYAQQRKYKTKAKGAQEAHEAIRPTYLENQHVEGSAQEKKLYELIWKRTIASQMSDAVLEKTNVNIGISTSDYVFVASGEVILFDGFLRVYKESSDDEEDTLGDTSLLPPLKVDQGLNYNEIVAVERFTQRPARYSEASLVKRMEDLGIGRPSTYAPTISTIINRGYVIKEDRLGTERKYIQINLRGSNIQKEQLKEIIGTEKSKMFPSDIGIMVNDFLIEHVNSIVDYNFTAKVEEQFDEIAGGKVEWTKMIANFYKPFHANIEKTGEVDRVTSSDRILGVDPKTGKKVSVRLGKFGPLAQLISDNEDEKPVYASLQKGQLLETINLEQALKLFELPRSLGDYEGVEIAASIGRFGPYIRFDKSFVSMPKGADPYTITREEAIELIEAKRTTDANKLIADFGEVQVLNGRFGPYIAYNKGNYKIPKGTEPTSLSLAACMQLIEAQPERTAKAVSKSKATGKAGAKTATKSTVKTGAKVSKTTSKTATKDTKTATKKKPDA